MTRVYIGNFGYQNVHWNTCRHESVLTLQTSAKCYECWSANDRLGWINWATCNLTMVNGQLAIPPCSIALVQSYLDCHRFT